MLFESLMRWLLPFSKPHAVYKWIWGRGYAKLPVHEFLLAVDDSPQKFELLIGIARREATFQPMRDFDCIASITKLHQEVPGRASRAIQSLSYMIFFFSLLGGELRLSFSNGFLAFFKSWQCKTAKSSVFCSLYSGFFRAELRYPVLWCSIVISGLKPCSRLLQILIFIYDYLHLYLLLLVLWSLFQGFTRLAKLILGYLFFFFKGDVIWPHLVSMNI